MSCAGHSRLAQLAAGRHFLRGSRRQTPAGPRSAAAGEINADTSVGTQASGSDAFCFANRIESHLVVQDYPSFIPNRMKLAFSERTNWKLSQNRFTQAVEEV